MYTVKLTLDRQLILMLSLSVLDLYKCHTDTVLDKTEVASTRFFDMYGRRYTTIQMRNEYFTNSTYFESKAIPAASQRLQKTK